MNRWHTLLPIVALAGCGTVDTGRTSPAALPASCASIDLFLASEALRREDHPCRSWVEATHGRLVAVGVAFSGTIVSTAAERGAGLLVTCQHCGGPGGGPVTDPETDPPPVLSIGPPARMAGDRVGSRDDGRKTRFYFAHRLYGPVLPASALDAKGNMTLIQPRDDFTVAAVSGRLIEVVGHLGAIAPPAVDDSPIPLVDPKGLAETAHPWADAAPGAQVLILGFPRDLEDRSFGGELVASAGEVLGDAAAGDLLSRADADEAAIAYDPEVERIVAARSVSGMSGGGVFDTEGRFVGVAVRATVRPVDGKYLTRVVRASFIAARLEAAMAASPTDLRARVSAFLPPKASP